MEKSEFGLLMGNEVSGYLADAFEGTFLDGVARFASTLFGWQIDYHTVQSVLLNEGVGGVTELVSLNTPKEAQDRWSKFIKATPRLAVDNYRGQIYKKCVSLGRLGLASEAELKKLADEYISDFYVRIDVSNWPFEKVVATDEKVGESKTEEIKKSKLLKEIDQRSDALKSIFALPSTNDVVAGPYYDGALTDVVDLMGLACDQLIIESEFSGELAVNSSTDVYAVKMREVVYRSWAPKKKLNDCFKEMVDVWVSVKKGDAGWLWKLVGDGVAVDVLIKYGRSTWDPYKGGGPVQVWSEGSLITY